MPFPGDHTFQRHFLFFPSLLTASQMCAVMSPTKLFIVGEILVKYMPLANNHLVKLLEREGAEVVVPDFFDFVNYSAWRFGHWKESGSDGVTGS